MYIYVSKYAIAMNSSNWRQNTLPTNKIEMLLSTCTCFFSKVKVFSLFLSEWSLFFSLSLSLSSLCVNVCSLAPKGPTRTLHRALNSNLSGVSSLNNVQHAQHNIMMIMMMMTCSLSR